MARALRISGPSPAVGCIVKGIQIGQFVPPDHIDHDQRERRNDPRQVLVEGHAVL